MDIKNDYRIVIKIRAFEELILDLFGRNKLSGTTHTYIGEEATAAAFMNYIKEEDTVFSNHRCHGHYLAYGGPAKLLLAEIMSKESGLCQGRGGSQHIHFKNFYTNGIQGGIVPNAVGVALANKYQGKQANTAVFLGDGTLGQGVVYEAFNIASVYSAPVVFIIEDNQYAMSTKRTDVIAGEIKNRIEGFDIKSFEIESTDVDQLNQFFRDVFSYIDRTRKPVCAIVHNYRLGAHSKGDDTRNPAEVAEHQQFDPVTLVYQKIGKKNGERIYQEFRGELDRYVEELDKEKSIVLTPPTQTAYNGIGNSFLPTEEKRYVEGIRTAFENQLKLHPKIVIMGEDVREPYGGPFKATKGLSLKFDKQIINMPISEACMVGVAVGMSMNNMWPVVEMMFGDFITLGFDQLLNHASKYAWIYGDNVKNPLMIRVPSGAKRGYGPTHSQSLEKYLIGIPCIKVLALSPIIDPPKIYEAVFESINEPIIIIENKKLYGQKTWKVEKNKYKDFIVKEINNYGFPTVILSLDPDNKPDYYAVTYGGMAEDSLNAAIELMMKEEIQIDIVVLTQLSPLPIEDLKDCILSDVPVITIEEGTKTGGIGAEVIAQCAEYKIGSKYYRIATPDMPIPNGIMLECQIIPGQERIVNEIKGYEKR